MYNFGYAVFVYKNTDSLPYFTRCYFSKISLSLLRSAL